MFVSFFYLRFVIMSLKDVFLVAFFFKQKKKKKEIVIRSLLQHFYQDGCQICTTNFIQLSQSHSSWCGWKNNIWTGLSLQLCIMHNFLVIFSISVSSFACIKLCKTIIRCYFFYSIRTDLVNLLENIFWGNQFFLIDFYTYPTFLFFFFQYYNFFPLMYKYMSSSRLEKNEKRPYWMCFARCTLVIFCFLLMLQPRYSTRLFDF